MTTGALATIKTAGADATTTLPGLVIFKDRELAPAGVLAPMTTTTDVKLTMEQEAAAFACLGKKLRWLHILWAEA